MNIITKTIRELGSDLDTYGIFKARQKLQIIVDLVSEMVTTCARSSHSSHWDAVTQYNQLKSSQLESIKNLSDREYVRQAINYLCYMMKLLSDLDANMKGMMPGLTQKFQRIINTESLKTLMR